MQIFVGVFNTTTVSLSENRYELISRYIHISSIICKCNVKPFDLWLISMQIRANGSIDGRIWRSSDSHSVSAAVYESLHFLMIGMASSFLPTVLHTLHSARTDDWHWVIVFPGLKIVAN